MGQHLTGIAFLSKALAEKLSAKSLPESHALQEILQFVNQAIATTRFLARGLYPAVLDTGGLVSGLEQLTTQTRHLYGIECDFRCGSVPDLADPLVAINLYRIAQEAVNNAVKHAKGTAIGMELTAVEGKYRLSVSNDGLDIEQDALENTGGLGYRIMGYRASMIGASLAISKNPKGGTIVTVSGP